MNEIIELLENTIANQILKNCQDILPDEDLSVLGMDSLGFTRLIIEIEKKYDIYIEEEDMSIEKFNTINKINSFVLENKN